MGFDAARSRSHLNGLAEMPLKSGPAFQHFGRAAPFERVDFGPSMKGARPGLSNFFS